MPIPHFSVSVISRGTGASAVLAAAYRHAASMRAEATSLVRDYSGKAAELVHSEVSLPKDAPGWASAAFGESAFAEALADVRATEGGEGMSDHEAERAAWARISARLWNAVELHELRSNQRHATAQLSRALTIALPKELDREGRTALMRGYIEAAFTAQGMVADWVIHDKGDGNPHAHVMLTLRTLGEDGWGRKNRDWNHSSTLRQWRMSWAEHANLALERAGLAERVDLRTLKEQGLELASESYSPHIAAHAERAGEVARERMRCAEVRARNREWLRDHPEHIIAVVQTQRAVFTKVDLIQALASRLGVEVELLPTAMVEAVTGSDALVPVAGGARDGAQLFITRAKADLAGQLARGAGELAGSRLDAVGDGAGADAIETGAGPILFDVGTGPADETAPPSGRPVRGRAAVRSMDRGPRRGPSVGAVREALDARADELFRAAFGEPVRPGAGEWRAKGNESVSMQMRGTRRGLWHDHKAGEGGDLLDLVARSMCGLSSARVDFPRVLAEAARWAGVGGDAVDDAWRVRQETRERAAEAEAEREARRRLELVRRMAGAALPVAGSAAGRYLVRRGVTDLPENGIAYLPPVQGGGVMHAREAALVVWATDGDGRIMGGQRILVDADGRPAAQDVRKPSFGAMAGAPARFPARDGTDGPLVIAEGPESALSIRMATGLETWAVFGVSGWKGAPVPVDRDVILAPDRDAPDSPAGRAFRKAVAHHLRRGCRLRIALAPEPEGSKRDLNDTLVRSGADTVRAAVEGAREVRQWLPEDLNTGQRAAAEAMLGPDRVTLVKGHAGTGKTHTLRAVAETWAARGVAVLAGAPSGRAVQELAGLGCMEAATLSAWEARWARGERPEPGRFVFVMDEAGMVGLDQWARIQAQVGAMGGKLVAVGDPEQLQPVSDLAGWTVAERGTGPAALMDMVVRQRDRGDAMATEALARGGPGIAEAVRHHIGRGALRLDADTLRDPVAALAAAYWEDGGRPGPDRVALAYSNRDVRDLNAAIRAEAVRRGLLGEGGTFGTERVSGASGDRRRGTVRLEVAAGDRLILTQPHRGLGLARSSFGTVEAVRDSVAVLRMDGADGTVEIDMDRFRGFDHGYAATVHKAQGMTVDEAFVLPHRAMGRHATYVALSRHRNRVTVFGRRGHLEDARGLHRMADRRVDALKDPPEGRGLGSMVPLAGGDVSSGRPDWTGPADVPERPGDLAADRHLMAVASRVAGLLSADRAGDDPLVDGEVADPRDHVGHPERVTGDLVARHSVVRADEVAAELARQVRDPETFLRLFRQAMEHGDLVALPGDGRDPWVYSTKAQVRAELAAVDRGMRLAATVAVPEADDGGDVPAADPALAEDQRTALAFARSPGGLRIIEGAAGSGKTRTAAAICRAERAAGRTVTVISPTEGGRTALVAEGARAAMTLDGFFADPVPSRATDGPGRVLILDDAHGLGAGRAEAVLARAGAMGAKLVAMVNPDRRPAEAGPTFRTLAGRLETARLTGLHGALEGAERLRSGGGEAERALGDLRAAGHIHAAGTLREAVAETARRYVADGRDDRIALAWGRAEADALTEAIRARLDEVDPVRAAFRPAGHGALAGLKPGDRIRFSASGSFGAVSRTEAAGAGGIPGRRRVAVRRGELAEVLGPAAGGGLRLRVSGPEGGRDIEVAAEGPGDRSGPRWHHAFASTITAAAGRRHDSVHLLASPAMDRETLVAGAMAARKELGLVLPVDGERIGEALSRIARRERAPRAVLDHGFDPALAAAAAASAVLPDPVAMPDMAGTGETGRFTAVPEVPRAAARLRAANAGWLRDGPENVIAVVACDRPVFGEDDIRWALRERLARDVDEDTLRELGDRAMASEALVRLAAPSPDGAAQFTTAARVALAREAGEVARALARETFAPGRMPVVRPDRFAELNATQRRAAEAMLSDVRLTLVQGRAGAGKTHTLRAAAAAWNERGVAVLAGAPSGRAVRELAGVDGLEAATLAGWEARWARGERPEPGRFVFVMDEAGMVGAGQWARIQAQVAAMGGKLVAVGDPDQLQPVSDLPGWAIAERASGGRVSVLDTVMRQEDPLDRQATEALARGGDNVAEAVRHYGRKGGVRIGAEVLADPVAALAEAYWSAGSGDDGGPRIALAYTNRDVHDLNDAIRRRALACGAVDARTVRSYGTVKRRVGQGAGARRVRAAMELGVGERIMLTAANAELGLPRSAFGTVTEAREDGLSVLFDGERAAVEIDPERFGDFDYGYAATVHKAQGMTADDVLVLPHRAMHRHAVYVALSRHRRDLAVFGRVGHVESLADLVGLGQAAGNLDLDLPEDGAVAASHVPGAGTLGLDGRADWRASGVETTQVGFMGDPELMAVAERHVGLMAVDRSGPRADPREWLRQPERVIDDLLERRSVIRAEDVAGRLSGVTDDPEVFLRLFRQAMSRDGLVTLGRGSAGERVYSTETQVRAELEAVDRGVRLALSPADGNAPAGGGGRPKVPDEGLDGAGREALAHATAPGRLRLVRGDGPDGGRRLAGMVAEAHERAGWRVTALSPTGGGLDGLRAAGVPRPRTVARFLSELREGPERGLPGPDAGTVVILDDAGRLGGREAAELLERVEGTGARLVAFMGGTGLEAAEAGPVFRALEARIGSARTGVRRPGAMGEILERLGTGGGGREAVDLLQESGAVEAAGSARAAVDRVAKGLLADSPFGAIALARSRDDVERLTAAVRDRLDRRNPGRAAFAADRDGPLRDLKPADRIRFLGSVRDGGATPAIRAGETATVLRRAAGGGLELLVGRADRKDASRVVTVTRDMADLPEWRFAFAGTIHGEAGRPHESVHVLAHPGMGRQVLAAALGCHTERVRVVVPVPKARLGETLARIVRRDARAESVLDYGFDPAFGARAAMRGRGRETADAGGIAAAAAGLRTMAGLPPAKGGEALPVGLGGEVVAEVIGAAALRDGAPPSARDRDALEGLLRDLTDPGAWRRILRQVPADVPRRADVLAREVAGTDGGGRMFTTARMLARGALVAEATGEGRLAGLLRDGLEVYGTEVALAREEGRPEARLVRPHHPVALAREEGRVDEMVPRRTAAVRQAVQAQRTPVRARTARSRAVHPPRRRASFITMLGRRVLSAWGFRSPQRVRPRVMAYAHEVRAAERRMEAARAAVEREAAALAGQRMADVPEAVARVRSEPQVPDGEVSVAADDGRFRGMALQLAAAVTERVDGADGVHRRDDLIGDIGDLLRRGATIDADGERLAELERGIVADRVTFEARRALARHLLGERYDDAAFARKAGRRARPNDHPLDMESQSLRRRYDASERSWTAHALGRGVRATETERALARALQLPDAPDGLAGALREVFRDGALRRVDVIEADRRRVVDGDRWPERAEDIVPLLYRSFTQREVEALAKPDLPLPASLPRIGTERRDALAWALGPMFDRDRTGFARYAWRDAALSLGEAIHPHRSRSRGMGMGL